MLITMDDVRGSTVTVVLRQQIVLTVFLWCAVMVSALMVVYSTYDTRNKFNELDQLRRHRDALQIIWSRYLLEESTWASYDRIETIAVDTLSMQRPTAEQMILVNINESSDE